MLLTKEGEALLDYLSSDKFEKNCISNRSARLKELESGNRQSINSVYVYRAWKDGVDNSTGEENLRLHMRNMGFPIGGISYLTNSEVRKFFETEE